MATNTLRVFLRSPKQARLAAGWAARASRRCHAKAGDGARPMKRLFVPAVKPDGASYKSGNRLDPIIIGMLVLSLHAKILTLGSFFFDLDLLKK